MTSSVCGAPHPLVRALMLLVFVRGSLESMKSSQQARTAPWSRLQRLQHDLSKLLTPNLVL